MLRWPKENKYDRVIKYALFLLWPFGAFFYSLRKLKTKSSYIVIFLFGLLYGLSFAVPFGDTGKSNIDATRYRTYFAQYFGNTHHKYWGGLHRFLTFKGDKDYYFDTVAYFVSRLTENYHIFFLVIAFVFSVFALKTFRFLTSEAKFTVTLSCLILVYLFMYNQIFNINGVRFFTAYWVAAYGLFQIYLNKNKKYYLLLCITPFIHGTYWIFLGILLIAILFKKYEKTWIILFFVSFALSSLAVEIIEYSTNFLPPSLLRFTERKLNPENLAGKDIGIIQNMFNTAVRLYINFMVYLIIRNSEKIRANPKTKNLYLFLLVWMTFSNFFMPIPTLGGRFIQLGFPIIAYIWLVHFKGVKYQRFLYFLPIVFALKIFIRLRYYFDVLPISFYFSNLFSIIFQHI